MCVVEYFEFDLIGFGVFEFFEDFVIELCDLDGVFCGEVVGGIGEDGVV